MLFIATKIKLDERKCLLLIFCLYTMSRGFRIKELTGNCDDDDDEDGREPFIQNEIRDFVFSLQFVGQIKSTRNE